MNDILKRLKSCEIFSGLKPEILSRIAAAGQAIKLSAGDTLFSRGQPRRTLFLLLEGQVEIRVEQGDAAGTLLILGAGEILGEAGLLGEGQHSATARALSDLTCIEFPLEALKTEIQAHAETATKLLSALSRMMVRRLQYSSSRRRGWDLIYQPGTTRIEHDLLGTRDVPQDALYGIQSLRGAENFPITGIPIAHFPQLIRALAMVKQAAVRANLQLKLIGPEIAHAIDESCREIIDGHWHGHFIVDVLQGGAGTSTNMNANEVIANRALELLGLARGDYEHCHPNNHVNLSQSTNDAYPTAVRLAVIMKQRDLANALGELADALHDRAVAFAKILKMGRTQLQDAVPMTLGQEFEAFAVTTREDIVQLAQATKLLQEINLGGTAIGTGINAEPGYPEIATRELEKISGIELSLAGNLVEATPDTGAFVAFSGTLKRIAVKLSKLCNDLRLLSSGPRCGLNEINLPPVQPGSSIMPGKVNPVIPEVVNQVAFQVIGNDLTITLAAEAGQLQLNVMEPVLSFNIFESLDMMTAAVQTLTQRCIRGITANEERCREMVENSIGLVTALVPVLGYERSSSIAREALATGKPIRRIVLEAGDLDAETLDDLLSPEAMTAPREMPEVCQG